MVLLGKTLAAFGAYVRPLAGVELTVGDEMPLQRERPAAVLAHEWPLAVMHLAVEKTKHCSRRHRM